TARDNAAASNTSTTTASIPSERRASALAAERLVPTTSYPASRSRGTRRLPIAPVAPARNILMMIAPFAFAKLARGKRSLTFLEGFHQVGRHRAFWSDVNCE